MTALNWSAEGGSAGTTITTANSGGGSGDAWDSCVVGASATNQYNAQAANGSLSALNVTGASSVQTYNRWQAKVAAAWPAGMTTSFGRTYLRTDALPAVDRTFAEMLDLTGATNRGNIRLRSTGVLRIRNAANATVVSGATVLSINTWYRVEWQLDGSVAGAWQLVLFLGNSTTPLETLSGSGVNFGGTIGAFSFGHVTNTANSNQFFFDDIQVNDTGLPGPYTPPAGVTQGRWLGVRAGNG